MKRWTSSGPAALAAGLVIVAAGAGARSVEREETTGKAPAETEPPIYDDWFGDWAMRVDLFHTGTSDEDVYSLDEVVWEPIWPGTREHLLDPFGYGTRRLRVTDEATGREIFRIGFATLFDEWTGTGEALAGVRRSMSESVRFPWPLKPVIVHLDRRRDDMTFEEVWTLAVDPASHLVDRTVAFPDVEAVTLVDGPSPDAAMDVLIVPEGYAEADEPKLRADLERFARAFVGSEPWSSGRDLLTVRGLVAFSSESGPSEPRKGIFRDTLLGARFNTFDSPRYLTVTHTKKLRQVAARAPYDVLLVMVNTGRYGGGGVYNQWAIFPSDNEYDAYVMIHEFGHHMGGLADEYYSSAVSTDEDLMYPPGLEPWEPNITALVDGDRENVKWHGLVSPDTPVPTPETGEYADVVGVFEGAGYKAKGLYRSQIDCKMFHKGRVPFCQVCRDAMTAMLRYYAGGEVEP